MSNISLEVKRQPDTVLFDAAGTLIYLPRSAGWHYSHIAARHGLEVTEGAMDRAFRSVWFSPPPRKPGRHRDDDKGWWRLVAEQTLEASIDVPGNFSRSDWFEELYEHFASPGVWALHDDALPAMRELHGHYRMAVVSNFDARLRRILRHLEIESYFEKMIISSEIGCEKPALEIFLHAAREMNTRPENCLHVGDDRVKDWHGATDAGMTAFRLQRPEMSLRKLTEQLKP